MTNLVRTGQILAGQTTAIVPVGDKDAPFTVTLISADANRKIEGSSTGAAEAASFYALAPDGTTSMMINTSVRSPISHIRVTGAAGDTYRVQ